jgi:protein-S-isoprenylcysteine O-methyltransferase Ste14
MNEEFFKRGGWWVVVQFILLLTVVALGFTCRQEPAREPFRLFSLIFLSIAAICGLAGLINLGRNLTPFPTPSPQTQLVRHGIYRWIRHPLYMAVFCASIGWSLFWQSWPALVTALVLAVFFDAKARHEERWLREQFPDYVAYARRVKRFIPWIY